MSVCRPTRELGIQQIERTEDLSQSPNHQTGAVSNPLHFTYAFNRLLHALLILGNSLAAGSGIRVIVNLLGSA